MKNQKTIKCVKNSNNHVLLEKTYKTEKERKTILILFQILCENNPNRYRIVG